LVSHLSLGCLTIPPGVWREMRGDASLRWQPLCSVFLPSFRNVKPRRILVPLDTRRGSEPALLAAMQLARESDGRLYLLRVLEAPAPTAGAAVRHQAAVQRAERYLATTRQRLAADGVRGVSTAVWSGSPAAAIVKAAELTEADVIVMATGGRTGPPRKLVGSVVERVLRGTTRPVLVVRPADDTVDASLGEAAPLPERAAPAPAGAGAAAPGAPVDRQASPRDSYQDALRDLQQLEREVLRIVTTIREGAKSLERWQAVHVAHAGAGFPKEVTMTGRVIDAATWPTARTLADGLAAWHSAAEAARVAWARMPQAERSSLSPPP
jgi:nucleotide-binding universal stress UspA family protein